MIVAPGAKPRFALMKDRKDCNGKPVGFVGHLHFDQSVGQAEDSGH